MAKLQDFDEKRLTFFHHFFSNSSQIANTTETLKKIVYGFFVRNGGFFVELFSYNLYEIVTVSRSIDFTELRYTGETSRFW